MERNEIFEKASISKALINLCIPTIISKEIKSVKEDFESKEKEAI